MRERIEDLGRLAVLLDVVYDDPVWDLYHGRKKDFVEHFSGLSEESKEELLHNFIYGLESVKEKISGCSIIAYGRDELNEPIE